MQLFYLPNIQAGAQALPDEEAFQMLRDGAGAHFDPEVVEAFFDAKDRILETRAHINAAA